MLYSMNDFEFQHTLRTDPEYLLRTALTHDWDNVAAFCKRLQTKENDMSNRCRRQLQACDQYGNSVLQAACYYRPPVFAVKSILDAAEDAHCRDDLLSHQAMDQSTALQVACATGADQRVLELLLVMSGSGNNSCQVLYHKNVLPLLTTFDQQGSTPVSELVVQYTLERRGPFHVRRSQPLEQIVNVKQEIKESAIFRLFWSKLELLLRSAFQAHKENRHHTFTMLKGAAVLACTCPSILVTLLLRNDAEEQSCDGNHHCLVHLALEKTHPPTHPVLQRQLYEFISRILKEKSNTRHMLYETAIRQGHAWPIVDLLSRNQPLTTTTNTPYFLQAAALAGPDLDTVYGLLRRYPQALCELCK